MSEDEEYADWLHDLSYLSCADTMQLPRWQRTIAFTQQFAVTHLNDGAGALFYNHPEKVRPVIKALHKIGEGDLAKLTQKTATAIGPFLRWRALLFPHKLVNRIMKKPIASMVEEIDQLIESRWDNLHGAMRTLANANGWRS